MNEPLPSVDPIPEPIRESRWATVAGSFLAALVLNGLILGLLLFISVGEVRLTPPTIHVTSIPEPEEPPIASLPLRQPKASISAGAFSPSSALTVTATAISEISITLPDLPTTLDGISDLAGIGGGFGSGFGTGFGTDDGVGSMNVGSLAVKSMKLGVILDVSPSMTEKLPKVKQEVRIAFRHARTVDVEGCRLDWKEPKESGGPPVRLKGTAESVIEAAEMLIIDGRVDALYWFSDLQDGETEEGLTRLRELLNLGQGRTNAVRLYIRTLEREPSRQLKAIVRATGGAIQAGSDDEEKNE